MIRPGLHPPLPAVRINNNLLFWSSVSDPPRDRVDSFSSTLRRRRNMGKLDRRCGIGSRRLATVQRNAENQQQRSLQENWDQQSRLHVTPQETAGCARREAPRTVLGRNLAALSPGVHPQRGRPLAFSKCPHLSWSDDVQVLRGAHRIQNGPGVNPDDGSICIPLLGMPVGAATVTGGLVVRIHPKEPAQEDQ